MIFQFALSPAAAGQNAKHGRPGSQSRWYNVRLYRRRNLVPAALLDAASIPPAAALPGTPRHIAGCLLFFSCH